MEGLPQDRLTEPEGREGRRFAAVVIGGSAGGIRAVTAIVAALPPNFALPVVVVLHQGAGDPTFWVEYLGRHASLPVVEAEDKLPLTRGTIHCAPADYHLLVERDGTLALSMDERVNYSRPSIDLLFASAAEAYGPALIGVVLTGANSDGARGLAEIAASGGLALVQAPVTAEWPAMPEAALRMTPQALVVPLDEIATTLTTLTRQGDSLPARIEREGR